MRRSRYLRRRMLSEITSFPGCSRKWRSAVLNHNKVYVRYQNKTSGSRKSSGRQITRSIPSGFCFAWDVNVNHKSAQNLVTWAPWYILVRSKTEKSESVRRRIEFGWKRDKFSAEIRGQFNKTFTLITMWARNYNVNSS